MALRRLRCLNVAHFHPPLYTSMTYIMAARPTSMSARLISILMVSSFVLVLSRQAKAIGPDKYGYTAASIPVLFEDLTEPGSGSTAILDNSNDDAVIIPIGFTF